jgi:hypothetical protein
MADGREHFEGTAKNQAPCLNTRQSAGRLFWKTGALPLEIPRSVDLVMIIPGA